MKVIYCSNLNDIPDYPLKQMFDDEPGWESKAVKQGDLDLRTVYRHNGMIWIAYKKQPELTEELKHASND